MDEVTLKQEKLRSCTSTAFPVRSFVREAGARILRRRSRPGSARPLESRVTAAAGYSSSGKSRVTRILAHARALGREKEVQRAREREAEDQRGRGSETNAEPDDLRELSSSCDSLIRSPSLAIPIDRDRRIRRYKTINTVHCVTVSLSLIGAVSRRYHRVIGKRSRGSTRRGRLHLTRSRDMKDNGRGRGGEKEQREAETEKKYGDERRERRQKEGGERDR